jgi:type I restriction-modification system DNA methylase subunit
MSDKIINTIHKMSGKYGVYEIFADWVKMQAFAYANQVQYSQAREDEYIEAMKRYSKEEFAQLAEMTAWLVEWADEQFFDMLGYIYMHLEIGNKRTGQFFTPYNICQLMAKTVDFSELPITANEPTCGAGGNIIALAEAMKDSGINYQHNLMVVCQDIDIKAVYMAFVQMSLYGIPAIVYQSDTLLDPLGHNSTTGKMYTVGYMLAPELWNIELTRKTIKEAQSVQAVQMDQVSRQMTIDDLLKKEVTG